MNISKEWYRDEFINHESLNSHISVEKEMNEYIAIAEGNLEYIGNQTSEAFLNLEGKGRLSDNDLQNLRYHFVVSTAMITRYCAMNGMEQEKAYSLSDFYIKKMDKCITSSEIAGLHHTMCLDYCNKMHILRKNQILSKPVVLCMDYIYKHIHSRITIRELAQYIDLSESYLSKLFIKEIGMPISSYITLQKIEKAKNLLSFSDYSLADIANYLAFSSQSHFIQVFQKHVGITPHKYRNIHFRNQWDDLST